MLWTVVVTGVLAYASPGQAQTADFKCANPGTIVDYSDGARAIWLSQDGNSCRGQFKDKNGAEFPFAWYLPTVGLRSDRTLVFAEQVKPWTVWPLAVGKKLSARYDGPAGAGSGAGTWYETITVDRYEKLTTKAGTFDVFVVTHDEQAISHSYKSKQQDWYSPETGVTLKTSFTDNQGASRTREAVSIHR
ncbi:MAG: hypothetical protein JSR47_14080 [Proteobacteria bacterium]|nr:hypothetical protein [Pseudomonadota bacterium]